MILDPETSSRRPVQTNATLNQAIDCESEGTTCFPAVFTDKMIHQLAHDCEAYWRIRMESTINGSSFRKMIRDAGLKTFRYRKLLALRHLTESEISRLIPLVNGATRHFHHNGKQWGFRFGQFHWFELLYQRPLALGLKIECGPGVPKPTLFIQSRAFADIDAFGVLSRDNLKRALILL